MELKPEELADAPPRPDEPAYSEDGVDLTLIRWFLTLTPGERLDYLQNFASTILEMRRAGTGL